MDVSHHEGNSLGNGFGGKIYISTATNLIKKTIEKGKCVIRSRKPKKARQHNGQRKKDKITNNDLKTLPRIRERTILTPQKNVLKSGGQEE